MKSFLSKRLISLAEKLNKPLYLVGGIVRNFLICKNLGLDFQSTCVDNAFDFDLCSPLTVEEITVPLESSGFFTVATYKRTNTVVFKDETGVHYEFTSFRTEKYHGGEHTPFEVMHTEDITLDALRRDFKCNAVYYDIKSGQFIDPLGGIIEIEKRIISTADQPEKVFRHDGLRLLRLARFAGELGFTVEENTLLGAKKHRENVNEIVPERIFEELKRILVADKKYAFSLSDGHYTALKVLEKTRVLDLIIPQLALGRNMVQRKDFHNYDVLEHSLKTVLYADASIRFHALLHDVGKPFAMKNYGKYTTHDIDGEKIAVEVLTKLKAPKKLIEEIAFLTKYHMFDLELNARENKVRLFIVKNFAYYEKMLLLKQADFSAGKDDLSLSPTVKKWQAIYQKMLEEKVPFKYSDLMINGKELETLGFKGSEIKLVLERLHKECVFNPKLNDKERLKTLATKINLQK